MLFITYICYQLAYIYLEVLLLYNIVIKLYTWLIWQSFESIAKTNVMEVMWIEYQYLQVVKNIEIEISLIWEAMQVADPWKETICIQHHAVGLIVHAWIAHESLNSFYKKHLVHLIN
jgi:hypothetical protein